MRTCRTCGLRFIGKRCPECKAVVKDEMTNTPKPPEGYETWLDWLLNEHRNGYSTPVMIANRELSELRAYKAAYMEAMAILRLTGMSCLSIEPKHPECELCRFFRREMKSGRFKP